MSAPFQVLDLFSAAAGGWSLGLHRAGFQTIAACEVVPWRRALYAENNPGVLIYDDVATLTAARLLADLGRLPDIIVGSPPCQDISSANTKGKGVEGERSGLYFEAIRLVGECRPRWFAFENSANLRTRGADAVLAALEALDYACWPLVVRAGDIGANHERPRSWLIGCDLAQVTDANSRALRVAELPGGPQPETSVARDADQTRNTPDPDQARQARQAHGCVESGLRQAEITDDGRGSGRSDDGSRAGQMGLCAPDSKDADSGGPLWSLANLADHLRVDDGLSRWLADTRIAIGGSRGTAAASLIVEAFGDSVIPQIPEVIGRAILRVEAAMAACAAIRETTERAANMAASRDGYSDVTGSDCQRPPQRGASQVTEKIFVYSTPQSHPHPECEHDFQGWREFDDGLGDERVCSKCGIGAMEHTLSLDDLP